MGRISLQSSHFGEYVVLSLQCLVGFYFWSLTGCPPLEKNHKKKIGLYRAKATRFAGKVREMGRMLRLKADLQEVVISAEYKAQKWPKTKKELEAEAEAGEAEDEEDEEVEDGEDPIKKIVIEESGFWKPLVSGFWKPLVDALKVRPPATKIPTDASLKPWAWLTRDV